MLFNDVPEVGFTDAVVGALRAMVAGFAGFAGFAATGDLNSGGEARRGRCLAKGEDGGGGGEMRVVGVVEKEACRWWIKGLVLS